jgi:hypothetical protein
VVLPHDLPECRRAATGCDGSNGLGTARAVRGGFVDAQRVGRGRPLLRWRGVLLRLLALRPLDGRSRRAPNRAGRPRRRGLSWCRGPLGDHPARSLLRLALDRSDGSDTLRPDPLSVPDTGSERCCTMCTSSWLSSTRRPPPRRRPASCASAECAQHPATISKVAGMHGARVVLIGGTSNVGKSTLAQAVAERLGFEYLSTDGLARHPGRPWPPSSPRLSERHSVDLGHAATSDLSPPCRW